MSWIENHWHRVTPVSALLFPASLAFAAAAALRRAAYRTGIRSAARLPVPIIVVGNISVGGTGKTPLTLWLAEFLRARGRTPGIVCRGYGGKRRAPRPVLPDSEPREDGDEAVLLARRSGTPVWAGVDRAAAARALIAAHPACDVVISDDGLQHYALARDLEICVIDARRGFGNGLLLPAGPLREPTSRLARVDAIVINGNDGSSTLPVHDAPCFGLSLRARGFRALRHPERLVEASRFRGTRVHAVAGIGSPARFFSQLDALGVSCDPHAFPDHHPFVAADLAFERPAPVVMTEKDAVKCDRFAREDWWALVVDAAPDPALGEMVLKKLGASRR